MSSTTKKPNWLKRRQSCCYCAPCQDCRYHNTGKCPFNDLCNDDSNMTFKQWKEGRFHVIND